MIANPEADTVLRAGDMLGVLGEKAHIEAACRLLAGEGGARGASTRFADGEPPQWWGIRFAPRGRSLPLQDLLPGGCAPSRRFGTSCQRGMLGTRGVA